MERVRVVYSPFESQKILVVLEAGSIDELAKRASIEGNRYPDRPISASCDSGTTVVDFTAEERRAMGGVTATDFYEQLLEKRGMSNNKDSHVFDIIAEGPGENRLQAVYKEKNDYQSIYFSALEAARLSRAYGKEKDGECPVIEFEYRGKTIAVDGKTDPVAIEAEFPEGERQRAVYVPPKVHFHSVKDEFNVVAVDGGVQASYTAAQSKKNDMHVYYVAQDLVNLSREYNNAKVQYNFHGYTLHVDADSDPKEIQNLIPEADQWPGGKKQAAIVNTPKVLH